MLQSLALCLGLLGSATALTLQNNDPLIYFHGRWDSSPGSWWASTGFKLNVTGVSSLTLNLGSHTSSFVPLSISVDGGPFVNSINVTAGSNNIPLGGTVNAGTIRFNAQGWQNNRLNLESIVLNDGAEVFPYIPSKLAFQFIGDSLSAGQYVPQGVDQAWPFLTGEAFNAEHTIIAQPGITLHDQQSYGNVHGMSYMYFQTEDPGYSTSPDHDYTTPWNFTRDVPAATHVVIHIGANDNGQGVSSSTFVQTYNTFLDQLRQIYVDQPIFVFSPWGWPGPTGVGYYYQGDYQQIVSTRQQQGDQNIYLVDTTGWVTYNDIFHDNLHPTVAGHIKIAGEFETWLKNWGLEPA
ncbi:hypothetical protein PLICRDRAFT_40459 [Plicaturopsis crispa FD-325 SS-3]|nr:hypothetical protein PLICRDRAFT_40459 [Plicaturopsis crispa FD-325 SS-3]